MSALTDFAELQTLRWLVGKTGADVPVAPVLPLRVALLTEEATELEASGVEVVNASGSTYSRQNITFGVVDEGEGTVANTNIIRFDGMPDIPYDEVGDIGGVRGFAVYDSADRRWWYANLANPRGYAAGDAAEFPVGQLVLAID